jgi:hypothetical protein
MNTLRSFLLRTSAIVFPLTLLVLSAPAAWAAAPTIASLSPSSATAGGTGFTLSINGANFVSGATASWGGAPLTVTYKSANLLTASITSAQIAAAGSVNVTVTTAAGTSSAAKFTINPAPAATPAFSPAAGTYTSAQTVTISDATAGAIVYYTTNGSTPTTSSATYNAPIAVGASETVKAIATANGYATSATASAAYVINLPAATPTFSPAAGTYTAAQTVTIKDATAGAIVYYTTNGSTPTTSSAKYTAPIAVGASETVKAIATATGYSTSATASAAYVINLPAATPTFSPAAGTYTSVQTVTIKDATAGAVIYYTTDGTTPTASSANYTVPIAVGASETVKAIATATGYSTSATASAAYVIDLPAATPTFSPAAGTYTSVQTVIISDTTPGALIFYTTNGSTPTGTSTKYTAPITVGASETVKAIATASGYSTSATGSAAYVIDLPAATPTFSPAAGTYTSAQTVTIKDATSGAIVYYTTNGSVPTTGSTKYTAPIKVSATETINAIATASGYSTSATGSAAYVITLPAATPTFSPAAGSFTSVQTVTIADTTPGASIFYTTNGSTPTASSTPYSGPISVGATETVKAVATATGFSTSAVGAAAYTITLPTATPTFSPAAGTYTAAQTVTISDATTGAIVYYTTNGSAPTTASTKYTAPIAVNATETIKAIATASGYSTSATGSAAYTINPPAATPTFSPAAGTFTSVQTVTIKDATANSTIYYTTNGSTPSTSSTPYTGAITVGSTETLQAVAIAPNYSLSAVATAAYTIDLPPAATPTFSVPAGAYTSTRTVSISDATSGATIYYTTNGTAPTTSSTPYTSAITVSASETLEAIATAPGFSSSAVATAAYTINPPAATPTFSPAAGTFTSAQTVTISDATSGASIYYTTNGSAPSTSSTPYTSAIAVGATETLQAVAIAPNYSLSAVATAAYTINLPPAATPVFSPAAGTYSSAQAVTISDATTGASIYYTTNGSTPSTSSTPYSGAIAVSATETLEAIAAAPGYSSSAVAIAAFTINSTTPTITGLSPSSATVGGPGFTLTVNGTNFVSGATVNWGTTVLQATVQSPTLLTAAVPASLIAAAGSVSVTVTTTAGASSPATFTVTSGAQPACSNDGTGNAKLQGTYSFQFTQTDPTNNGQLSLNLGSFTADGAGNIGAGLSDSNGPAYSAEQQSTFTGTYSIGPDDRGLLSLTYTSGATSYLCFALDSFASSVAASGRLVSDDTNVQIDSGTFYSQGQAANSLTSVQGSWAFGLQGVKLDSYNGLPTRQARAGYLTLDGAGHVTAGEIDMSGDAYDSNGNLTNKYTPQSGFTGTYTMNAGGRGTMALTFAGCGCTSNSIIYAAGPNQILVLTADPGGVGNSAVMAGRAYLRTTSTFNNATLSGTSVVVGQALSNTGSDNYNNRLIEAGILTWTGAGSLTESFDQNDAGNVTLQQTASGTYSVDTNGRVTLNQTSPAEYGYLVGPNRGIALGSNLGVDFRYFENQTVPSGGFTSTSFDGGYSDGSLWYGFEQQKAKSGEILSDGAGDITGTFDVDPLLVGTVDLAPRRVAKDDATEPLGPVAMYQTVGETYTATGSGRFLVTNGSLPWEALYFVSPNKAYAIDIGGAPWQPLEEINHQ